MKTGLLYQIFEALAPRSYVESLLRAQLAAAIGKEVSVQDFSDYMRRLPEFRP